jgi:hypothetical protein
MAHNLDIYLYQLFGGLMKKNIRYYQKNINKLERQLIEMKGYDHITDHLALKLTHYNNIVDILRRKI